MRYLAACFMSLLLSLPALAEPAGSRPMDGGIIVNYSVFNSTLLQPNVAMGLGMVRDGRVGIINIAPMKDGAGLMSSLVKGKVRNLLGQSSELEFRRVVEGNALYFLATFPVETREVLNFEIRITTPKGTQNLDFSQEVFPEAQ